MSANTETITYSINIEEPVKDSLLTAEELIAFLQDKMKVKNSKTFAKYDISYGNNGSYVDVSCALGKVSKKNMKLYVSRFLRSNSLKKYIRVSGEAERKIVLKYVNAVDEAEE